MTSAFIDTLIQGGLAGIFLLTLTEKLIPVIPSYALLVLLGMTSVAGPGDLVATIGVSVVGSTAGSLGMFALGRILDRGRIDAAVTRFGRYLQLDSAKYAGMVDKYRKRPFRIALIAQWVPVVRVFLALPAGALRLSAKRFGAATALGATGWNAAFLSLGYAFRGSHLQAARIGFWLLAFLVFAQVAVLAVRIASRRPPALEPVDQPSDHSATQGSEHEDRNIGLSDDGIGKAQE